MPLSKIKNFNERAGANSNHYGDFYLLLVLLQILGFMETKNLYRSFDESMNCVAQSEAAVEGGARK